MNIFNPSKTSGYRQKPLWIYLAAAVLILTPFGNLLWSLATLHIPNWYKPHVWGYWVRYVAPSTWVLLSLIFISGVCLLFVRRWSWMLSVFTLSLVSVYDLVMIRQFSVMGTLAIVTMIIGTLAFGLLLYFTEFRRPYLNPRLRWWETEPRYKVDLPVSLRSFDSPATLVDISKTGVLIEFTPGGAIPEIEGRTTITLPTQIQLPAAVSRKTERGYGLQFESLDGAQKKALKQFIVQLSVDPRKLIR